MKRISLYIDDSAEKALEELMINHGYSITDAVNISLVLLNSQNERCSIEKSFYEKFKELVFNEFGTSVSEWCAVNGVSQQKLRYVCRRYESGHTITGFGNYKNKWRDKSSEGLFKTETAKIANCIKRDFGIEVDNN